MVDDSQLRKVLESLSRQTSRPPLLPRVKIKPVRPLGKIKFKRQKVFVSFDYENDAHYKRLLEAWSVNMRFDFVFQDFTPQEIQSASVARVKAVLTTKVTQATHTLVLVGKYANQLHRDRHQIGFRNWINFEIHQSRLYNKKIVAVMLSPYNKLPDELIGSGSKIVGSFNENEIIRALNGV